MDVTALSNFEKNAMANLNDKTNFICGRNPFAVHNAPTMSVPEQESADLWISENTINQERSCSPNAASCCVNSCDLVDYTLDSDLPSYNGVVIENSTSVLIQPKITLSGCGCSDFTCKGTGLLAEHNAKVDVRNGTIITHGATRPATIATSGSTLKLFHTHLATYGGPLPEDYVPTVGLGFMEPPAPLGLSGTCRTHLSMDNSETFFYDCSVYAEAWGALSTDSAAGYVYLEANRSTVTVKGNGYCTYADKACHVTLNDCNLSSGNLFGIQDGNSSIRFLHTIGICSGSGFLLHGGMHDLEDIGTLRLDACDLTSGGPMFRCKSSNADIYAKNCKLASSSGTILETMFTDDPYYVSKRSHCDNEYGVQVTFEAMSLVGDFVCADPERPVKLNLIDASVMGAITGYPTLRLSGNSVFTATKDSEIVLVGDCLNKIDAISGVTISVKGSGVPTDFPSGGSLLYTD